MGLVGRVVADENVLHEERVVLLSTDFPQEQVHHFHPQHHPIIESGFGLAQELTAYGVGYVKDRVPLGWLLPVSSFFL